MLPGLSAQLQIHCATDPVIDHAPCIDPCIHDQARTSFEVIGLTLRERRVQGIQEGSRRHLGGQVSRTRPPSRGRGVHGHSRVAEETHFDRRVEAIAPQQAGTVMVLYGEGRRAGVRSDDVATVGYSNVSVSLQSTVTISVGEVTGEARCRSSPLDQRLLPKF